jgi:uncharacterized protein YbaP (TraB family)
MTKYFEKLTSMKFLKPLATAILMSLQCIRVFAGPVPIAKPYYYEVSYQGHVSHILGTMHVGFDVTDLPPQVSSDLRASKAVFAEKNIDPGLLREYLGNYSNFYLSYLKDRDKFNSCRLTHEERDKLQQLGVPAPITALVNCDDYSYLFIDAHYVFPKIHSIDYELLDMAARNGTRVHELDSGNLRESAQHATGQLTTAQQTKALIDKETVEQLQAGSKNTQIAYANHHLSCDVNASVAYRTLAWSKDRALLKQLTQGSTFVAVGAAHVVCKTGLLYLLEKQGFTIKPVFGTANKSNAIGPL